MLTTRSHALLIATAVVAVAPAIYADTTPIYGGVTNDTTTYSSPSSPVNVGAGNGVGAAIASDASYNSYTFRLTTSGVQQMATLGGFTRAYASNASGTIVGNLGYYSSGTYVGNRAARWDAGTTAVTLLNGLTTTSASDPSYAYGINDSGLTVGYSSVTDSLSSIGTRAVYWTSTDSNAVELPNLGLLNGYYTSAQATVVSNTGVIAGTTTDNNGGTGTRAVVWTGSPSSGYVIQTLGTATVATSYSVTAISTDGTSITGSIGTSSGSRGIRWNSAGTATVLNPLMTTTTAIAAGRSYTPVGYGISTVNSVNNTGMAVGSSAEYGTVPADVYGNTYGQTGTQAVYWAGGSDQPTKLAGFGTNSNGSTSSVAYSINTSGLIAGYVTAYDASHTSLGSKAVVWYSASQVLDLNSLLSTADAANWVLTSATSISATNWVTGIGTYDPDGTGPLASYTRTFLLQVPATYVPEPASLAVLGLSAVGVLRRRRGA